MRHRGRRTSSLIPDRLHQRLGSEHGHHPLHVVGRDVEADLGLHVGQVPHQEVGVAHPGLDGPERVFDQASPFAHGSGPQVHSGLELIDHRFMLPARDLSFDRRRALSLDATAGATGPIPVSMQRHAPLDDGHGYVSKEPAGQQ